MLTYNLIHPSYAFLSLSSRFGALRFQVESSSGTLNVRNSAWSRVALKIYQVLTVLKLIQYFISAFRLSQSVELTSESLQSAVTVTAMSATYLTALVWSSEFAKNSANFIIMLTPLRKINLDHVSQVDVPGQVSTSGRYKKSSNKFVRKYRLCQCKLEDVGSYSRNKVYTLHWHSLYSQFWSYLRATHIDFFRKLPTFSIHEFLTIIVPIAVPLFLPAFYVIIIIGKPREMLMASLLTPGSINFGVLRIAAIVFDLILVTFIDMIFQFGFFVLCGAMAASLREIKDLEKRLRLSDADVMSARKMQPVWLQIRRFSIRFQNVNIGGSNCCYMGKLMTFSCCVLGTFYILRFGFEDVMSFAIALLAFEGIMFYVLCLGNAYMLTETMKDVLRNIKLMSQYHVGNSKRELRQMIKSVRVMAMMEGEFRAMSKGTTPEFVDFYLNQVIGLLLAF